jgi:hypothetical protein
VLGRPGLGSINLARIFHELMSRDRGDGGATRSAGACVACQATVPRYRGIDSEAYLHKKAEMRKDS